MPTYPLPTLAATVSAAGITAPSYADIYQSLQASFQSIFGSDAYIDPDSQDGQILAVVAKAMVDSNNATIAVFNSYSPATAQGAALSNAVRLNGIARHIPNYSTAQIAVVGVVGTVINNGVVADSNSNHWSLPASITIPIAGTITVTATCQTVGAIAAGANTINQIQTPTLGWQTATNATAATLGNPIETDAALRQRQGVSTAIPANTVLSGIVGAIGALAGVTRVAAYENSTGSTDSNGLPAHSICLVVQGGAAADIAQAIGQKKTPGAATYGSTTQSYADPITGLVYSIHYYILALSTIKVAVTGTALAGYSTNVAAEIKASIAAYINALAVGQAVQYTRMFAPAYLNGAPDRVTYEITALTTALGAGTPGVIDIPIAFNYGATCDPAADITVTIT